MSGIPGRSTTSCTPTHSSGRGPTGRCAAGSRDMGAEFRALLRAGDTRSVQKSIADYLKTQTKAIDDLDAKIRLGIDKLREYRTALISAAVTGKIDVREESV